MLSKQAIRWWLGCDCVPCRCGPKVFFLVTAARALLHFSLLKRIVGGGDSFMGCSLCVLALLDVLVGSWMVGATPWCGDWFVVCSCI